MQNINYLIILIIAEIFMIVLAILLHKQKKGQIKTAFICFLSCLSEWTICLIFQIALQKYPIDPFFFEKLSGIGAFFAPVSFFLLGKIFSQTKISFNWKYSLLFIIPICSLILAWTNDIHHLFVINYSINVENLKYGPYFTIHSIYTFALYVIGLWYFFSYSIKNSGFFSKQSILIIIGTIVPLVINLLGLFGVPMPVYMPPISFTITIIMYSLAIFKFDFLSVTPIALQRIVDRISDSYLVLNEKGYITDFNKTFLTTFKYNDSEVRGKNLIATIKSENFDVDIEQLEKALKNTRNSTKTISFEKHMKKIGKIFTVEINTIYSNDSFLGTLILFKDITQHIEDMKKIKDTQESLMESERLSSLGQLIGGIAHNLKTPIMSIAGAAEGLSDLIKEYDSSIDNPEVNSQDHHDIAKDMSEWITKIRGYTEYMSDVITAVKGQAVTLSNEDDISFTIGELLKRVDILMKHELKNALVYLNISMKTNEDILIHGDVNNLVQVINNMISNAIQSYAGKPEQNIDLIVERKGNDLTISIKDYGCGIPKKVKDKLFKEMITTKGKNGTGLGLYMSYSTIKAHFNGNISLESEEGKGTTFTITIPL